MKFVTTSWDDGHVLDLKVAALLDSYGLAGTFYISPKCREFPGRKLLTEKDVREISKKFEIGAHTMTHPRLTKVKLPVAKKEIVKSKDYLERLLGKKVVSFCYPGGMFNKEHKDVVKKAEFKYARTIRRFELNQPKDNLTARTSVHAYKHYQDVPNILVISNFNPIKFWNLFANWDQLAIELFNRTKDEGVFHIWGHSWEIEASNDWERLERVFRHIAHKSDVKYITNRELVHGK